MSEARIAVIGGGLMGQGIAQVFAAAGHRVCVQEPNPKVRAGMVSRVRANLGSMGMSQAAADLIETEADLDGGPPGDLLHGSGTRAT